MTLQTLFKSLASASLLVLAACGSSEPASAISSVARSEVTIVDELVYGQTSNDAFVYGEELTLACMVENGFQYQRAPVETFVPTADILATREFREEFGYALSIESDVFTRETTTYDGEDMAAYLSTLSSSEVEQYEETLERCRDDAEQVVQGARSSFIQALPSDLQEMLDAVMNGTDIVFIEIEDRWASCMAEAGFNYGGSLQLLQFLYGEFEAVSATDSDDDNKNLQALEREIAVADYDCAEDLKPELDARLAELELSLNNALGGTTLYG